MTTPGKSFIIFIINLIMDNTDIKINNGAKYERLGSTQATSNIKQIPITDESIYEKQNLLLIENDNDIKY